MAIYIKISWHGSRNSSLMSSIIKVGNYAATRTDLMPQVILQDNGFNQDGDDAALLNDEQYDTRTAHQRAV
jgi:N-acetylmuramoyl-L-alanine amidase